MTVIDEDRLAAVLRELGAAIDVPDDGPTRVLAARGPVPPGLGAARPERVGRSRSWPKVALGGAAAAMVAVAVALIVKAPPRTSSTTNAQHSLSANADSSAKSAGGVVINGGTGPEFGPADSFAAPSATVPGPATTPAPGVPTRVVKTGSVDLQVAKGRVSPTVDQVTALAAGLGGYVADAKTAEASGSPTGDLTLRVPADQFESLLSRVRALGKPTSVSTSGQDVTAAYVDLDARIQVLQGTRTQYLQILAKATAIGDILSVEQQLSALQTQIEQLQGQQKVLADQTSFGTLSVHLSESGSSAGAIPPPPGGFSKAWAHARHSFASGVEAVIGASGGIVVFLICAAGLLLLGRLTWPVIRRRLV